MRFTTYADSAATASTTVQLALHTNGGLLALPAKERHRLGVGLAELVRKGMPALREAEAILRQHGQPLDEASITYLPPIPKPPKIICVGLNYLDHTKESNFEQPTYPTLFSRFPASFVGHREGIVRPRCSEQFDYEGELVVFIGQGGRHIPKAKALDHVIGYSVCNEGSVRDYQFKTPQWMMGKNFDDSGSIGPAFVSADELPAGGKGLRLETRLNGVVVQSASTSDMVFDVASLISTLSEAFALEAGDVIVAGTPSGVGLARKPPLWMKAGDVCEVEIEGVGTLSNPVVSEG
jgi:acylpyruvate hydrolase